MSNAHLHKIQDDLITAELSRANTLSIENDALRAENARLRRGLENCHMLARRIVTSESAFFKINSAHHIIRMCEEAGVTSVKGVLKDAALQPERGGIQAAHVQACMECGKPVNDHQHLGSSISFHPTRKP